MRHATAMGVLLLLTLGLMACQSLGPSGAEAEEDVPVSEAVMDLRIGTAEGAAPYRFKHISGIAVDQDGRIVVTDRDADNRDADAVRAYDLEGRYLFTIAEAGKEPGDVNRPCCPTFGPDGHLWVRDDRNFRFNRYRLSATGSTPDGSIPFGRGAWGHPEVATTFDAEGHLIEVKEQSPLGADSYIARRHRSMDGTSVRTLVHTAARKGRLPSVEIPQGQFTLYTFQPMGPMQRHNHSPDGSWALMITDTYAVTWFDAAGDTLHVLDRDIVGPSLSKEEWEEADRELRFLDEQTERDRSTFPFDVPERKPVLANIFFDTDGRLWVQRSVKDGAPNEADVYTRDGTLAQVVQWPAGIDLSAGYLTVDTLYGIRQGGDTFPQVVRLRY